MVFQVVDFRRVMEAIGNDFVSLDMTYILFVGLLFGLRNGVRVKSKPQA
jgi:ABC-type long-subunit fatty acid transport system fused permease/ATPase subunit